MSWFQMSTPDPFKSQFHKTFISLLTGSLSNFARDVPAGKTYHTCGNTQLYYFYMGIPNIIYC